MKRKAKDDIGSTIDSEDNLAKMIMIEQALDATYEIEDKVSQSYAFCDCIIAILDFARETNNLELLERADELFKEIKNKGAQARALSYLAFITAIFNIEDSTSDYLQKAIKITREIRDDFDRRDAFLDIATSACDIYAITQDSKMIATALSFNDHLSNGQKSYLFGYLSLVLNGDKARDFMQKAILEAEKIREPITKSKVYLELASLMGTYQKKEDDD